MSTPEFLDDYSINDFETMEYNKLRQFASELPDVTGRSAKDDILETIKDLKEEENMGKKVVTSLTDTPTPIVTDDDVYPLRRGQSVEVSEVKNEDELGNKIRIEEKDGSSDENSTSTLSKSTDETDDDSE